ncbi:unnamed protein product [Urochloa humidicola]
MMRRRPPPSTPDPSPAGTASTPRSKIRSGRNGGKESASASRARARGGGRFALLVRVFCSLVAALFCISRVIQWCSSSSAGHDSVFLKSG